MGFENKKVAEEKFLFVDARNSVPNIANAFVFFCYQVGDKVIWRFQTLWKHLIHGAIGLGKCAVLRKMERFLKAFRISRSGELPKQWKLCSRNGHERNHEKDYSISLYASQTKKWYKQIMLRLRKSNERGHIQHSWLDTFHTFSFSEYYDPEHMHFRSLRVINEDRVNAGMGFPTHGHENMEIVTYVISGALAHKDSMGNSTVIRPGEVQRMTAGTGIQHSEFNYLKDQSCHLLQIWLLPNAKDPTPSYEQKMFAFDNDFILVGSASGRNGSILIHQDVDLYAGRFQEERKIQFPLRKERNAWIQIVKGKVRVNDLELDQGDGVAISEEEGLKITARAASEFLLFDLV
jgi:redox-sensitive bicupin YhaK (pirin superfamily)